MKKQRKNYKKYQQSSYHSRENKAQINIKKKIKDKM